MTADRVRAAYSAWAAEYVARLGSVEALSPVDRDLIAGWGDRVRGRALDAGCGPGHWTAFLHERGVEIEGLDMVPEFLGSARERFPHVPFRTGTLTGLGVADASLGGILAWFSLIHTADVREPLAEFARAVEPGGELLVGFCEGPEHEPFDHTVVTAWFWPVEAMAGELRRAGFEPRETHTRTDEGRRPQAAILATRV